MITGTLEEIEVLGDNFDTVLEAVVENAALEAYGIADVWILE